jgi:uncharacterized membrane protein YhiD involved in acid resistance
MNEWLLSWEDYLRLALAMVLGASIGFERELHGKPAGLKTIALVSLAGCLLAIMSIRLGDIAGGGAEKVDIARLAAGVLTGIGFIGAGTILQSKHHVEGITTAAVIWLMSAVGMAIGAGFYSVALAAYIIGWVALSLDPLGAWIMHTFKLKARVARGEEHQHEMEHAGPFGTAWEEEAEDEREESEPLKPPYSRQSMMDRKGRNK